MALPPLGPTRRASTVLMASKRHLVARMPAATWPRGTRRRRNARTWSALSRCTVPTRALTLLDPVRGSAAFGRTFLSRQIGRHGRIDDRNFAPNGAGQPPIWDIDL